MSRASDSFSSSGTAPRMAEALTIVERSGTSPTLTSDLLLGGAGDDVRELQLFAFVAPAAVLAVVARGETDRRAIGQRHREHGQAGAGTCGARADGRGLGERGWRGGAGSALNRNTAHRNHPVWAAGTYPVSADSSISLSMRPFQGKT